MNDDEIRKMANWKGPLPLSFEFKGRLPGGKCAEVLSYLVGKGYSTVHWSSSGDYDLYTIQARRHRKSDEPEHA